MTLDDLVKDIASTVKESVSEAVKGISEKYDARILELEAQIKALPAAEKGDKGDSVTLDDVRPLIDEAVKGLELPKGDKGDSVTLDDIRPIIDEAVKGLEIPVPDISHLEKSVKEAIDSIPVPKEGQDGVSPSADDVAKAMEPIFAKWALDFERQASGVLERAVERMPKPKDGKDALQVKDFDIFLGDDMRTLTVSLKAGEQVVEKSIKIPAIIDRGVHSDEKEYSHGDGVTYAGSFWICQKDRPQGKPSSSEDWRLAVKKGRDGKESVKIELPKTAKVGA